MDLNAENSYVEVDPEIRRATLSPSPARHAQRPLVSGTLRLGPDHRQTGSHEIASGRKGGVLAVSQEAGRFFSIPSESMGYCDRHVVSARLQSEKHFVQ